MSPICPSVRAAASEGEVSKVIVVDLQQYEQLDVAAVC
jgi:hypothetical protein